MAIAVVAFFLPWARIDLRQSGIVKPLKESASLQGSAAGLGRDLGRITIQIRKGAEVMTGAFPELSSLPTRVSGAQIPQMVNQEQTRVALAMVELLTNTRQHLGLKSYLVYLVPALAILLGLVVAIFATRRSHLFIAAAAAGLIAAFGFWKLLTTNTKALIIAITIGPGLWFSLWAYVGLALAAFVRALDERSMHR